MSGSAQGSRDYAGARLGMWLFLYTEFFFFFAPLLLYTVFRARYPEAFIEASQGLDLHVGALNTALLLTSSLTMALSVTALQRGRAALALAMLALTFGLGSAFLVNKYFEWGAKIAHGLYPGSEALLGAAPGQAVFYGLYFFLTGLHGLHVLAGLVAIAAMAAMVAKKADARDKGMRLENAGLYWHMVDIVWIYLFPVFYLIR